MHLPPPPSGGFGFCPFQVGGYVVVDLLFLVGAFGCSGSVFSPCFVMQYSVSFLIGLVWKRGLVALPVVLIFVTFIVLWLFLMVPLVGMQSVIVVFPDHTHFKDRTLL